MSNPRIPVTLLTGFLGSGKTTVLRHLLRLPGLARTLVIINELGEVGLDHMLVSRVADDTVVAMRSGCLCCTVRGDLISTLKDAHWRFARGGERQFDRVIIETTGLADPAPIIHTLMTVEVLLQRYRLDGVVTTLDLTCGGRTLDAHWEALKQAAVADCLLLTKADLADAATIASMERRLSAINPAAPRIQLRNGAVPPAALLGLGQFDPVAKIPDVARWLDAEAYPGVGARDPAPAGHADHAHGQDAHRHDDQIRTFCVIIDPPLEDGLLDAWLDRLLSLCGPDMLRIKGILSLRGRAAPVVIQGAQHLLYPLLELPAWPDDDRRSKIVFITRGIPRESIEESLAAFIQVWQGADTAPQRGPAP